MIIYLLYIIIYFFLNELTAPPNKLTNPSAPNEKVAVEVFGSISPSFFSVFLASKAALTSDLTGFNGSDSSKVGSILSFLSSTVTSGAVGFDGSNSGKGRSVLFQLFLKLR
ncbi:hypothetical protein AB6860_00730 [Carnobacterium divergens]|uniref:hypothetical protein n=1 Tax=Carnobacterium divergens TaxID=2748 RepID=UPI0039C9F229